jgi:cupredoxin-like protein
VTRIWATALILLAVGGCETGDAAPPNGPYVVTAVDYHFHDAHPSLPIVLDRAVQFSNQGRNPHNVTIEGTGFDRVVRPGQRITIDPIGSLLPAPGRYPFVCRFHADRGMSGVLVVVAST